MSLPQITVVTPVFNGAEHIAETLESVLRQDYPKLEYIIVDGGSTDETLEIIRGYEARSEFPQHISLVISEPDQGMYDAIAKGFEHATGEVFCYLNADDLFECDGLRSVGEYFSRHPETQVIYHEDTVLVDGWKFPNVRQPENVNTADLLNAHILFQDGVFFRRTAYDAIGGVRRDLKLAGDFDLWLRLSAHFRFVRRPGHVSCFRLRPDQLSSRMDLYHREMKQSTADFLSQTVAARRAMWFVQRFLWRAHRKYLSGFRRERLFFPIDGGNFPPPAATMPPGAEKVPRSPIDGKPAERFLFTTPDTRFGDRELNYIYLDERHEIAISHPHIAEKRLDALYQKHYSSPPTQLKMPETVSPYRHFNGQRKWEEILLRFPLGFLARWLFPAAWSDNIWADSTLRELIETLIKSKVDTSKELRFLDTGCFEGYLLDKVRDNTCWVSFGLEPNSLAVKIASEKGHAVWCGHAENASSVIPNNQQFDVIFMGQTIEHIDNPAGVLKQLKRLLAPAGVLVVSTPNLDSREIDWFGPTWAHWHPPYHRYIYSKKGLNSLAQRAGLLPVNFQTFSSPTWTVMSLCLNRLGLAGSVSHSVSIDNLSARKAQKINFWKEIIWNRLDKGDYCFFSMKNHSHGISHYD